jgi:hypothetical protein
MSTLTAHLTRRRLAVIAASVALLAGASPAAAQARSSAGFDASARAASAGSLLGSNTRSWR